jgi:FkbM family methyltransferase
MVRRVFKSLFKVYRLTISRFIQLQLRGIKRLPRGRFLITDISHELSQDKTKVKIDGKQMVFSTPNWLTHRRAKQLLNDEPETIAWIDSFKGDSVFWDIGANIGIYSIYAAAIKDCEVVAFEPAFLNLTILQENIELNDLSRKVTIFPIGLSNTVGIKTFYLSRENLISGGAHNSLGKPINQYGGEMTSTMEIKVPAETLNTYCANYANRPPDYIKIDVDGLELEVLQGASQVLKEVKEISIELLGNNQSDHRIHTILTDAGLSRIIDEKSNSRNVIYTRKLNN